MFDIEKTKDVILLRPQLKDNGDFANNTYVDTSGFGHLRVRLIVGDTDVAAGAAVGSTAEGTAPLVEECDTVDGSYTAVTGAALADSIAYNEDNSIFVIDIDLRKTHKRYMRVQAPHSAAGAANGSNLCILATLSEPQESPMTAAAAGLAEWIEV